MDANTEITPPTSRFRFTLRMFFGATAAVAVVCAAAAYAWRLLDEIKTLGFGSDRAAENLTYEEFSCGFGPDFDPQGASQISHCILATRDSYDQWTKMTIAADDYAALIERFSKQMDDPEFVTRNGKTAGPVLKIETDEPTFPDDWPRPDGVPPAWWLPAQAGQDVACTRWDVQVDDGRYEGRSKGWYWLYEPSTQMLRIWEWNRQHHRLRRR